MSNDLTDKQILENGAELFKETDFDRAWNKYKKHWIMKTTKQIKKESESWHKYMNKHSSSYHWHGGQNTPPGELADGDKLGVLREILREREVGAFCTEEVCSQECPKI